jgi:dienelactone hydrolase
MLAPTEGREKMRIFLAGLAIFTCLVHQAHADLVSIPLPDGGTLQAQLYRPAEPRSDAPAVVMLHGCGGPYPVRDDGWRDLFLRQGRVVLMPLSFASRGLGSQCAHPDAVASPYNVRRGDTIASVQWLTEQNFTPKGGVVVMGFSHGGSTVLAASEAMPDGLVRGYVALYPGCGVTSRRRDWHPHAPLAIFIGALDDWTLPKYCRDLADKQPTGAVRLTLYPDSYHDFDAPVAVRTREGTAGTTVHVGGNPTARAAVYLDAPAFIDALPPVAGTR